MTKSDLTAYENIDAINWSTLKHARESMLLYRHSVDNPPEDNPRFAIGRAIHTAILQPEKLADEYAVFEGQRRAGKAWDAFAEQNANKTILKAEEWQSVQKAAARVTEDPIAREWLNLDMALVERPITWIDPYTKLACKARPDVVHSATVEVKSCGTTEERRFIRQATDLGYFGQLAFYRRGYRELTKMWLPCAIVAVEVDPPHDVAVFVADEDSLRVADDEITRLLSNVAECRKSGKWPGRYHTTRKMVMPPYARKEEFNFDEMEAA